MLLSGASGFIGSRLAQSLQDDGHRVVRLVRGRATTPQDIRWDPAAGRIDEPSLAALSPEIVFNLAGEPIAQRWTRARMQRIRDSRVNGTRALSEAVARLEKKPRAFLSGSAIGYYGAHRGAEVLDESSASGTDWLADVASEWERATRPAAEAGIRVTLSRTGIVLGREGGALERMLPPFQLGGGGRIGSGEQWMSWISLQDTVRALRFPVP